MPSADPSPCPVMKPSSERSNLGMLGMSLDLQEAEHYLQAVWVSVFCSLAPAGLFQWFEEPPECASPRATEFSHFPLDLKRRALTHPPSHPPSLLTSQDRTCEAVEDTESGRMVKKMKKRICLVLDCLCAHDFSDKTADLINLQHYVIKEKRLSERETVVIFYDVVRVVEALHQVRPRTPRATVTASFSAST